MSMTRTRRWDAPGAGSTGMLARALAVALAIEDGAIPQVAGN